MADQEFFVTGKGYTAEDKLLGFLERNAKELILKDSSWGIYGKKNGYVLRSDQGVLEEGHNVCLCEMCNMGSLKKHLGSDGSTGQIARLLVTPHRLYQTVMPTLDASKSMVFVLAANGIVLRMKHAVRCVPRIWSPSLWGAIRREGQRDSKSLLKKQSNIDPVLCL